MCIYVCVYKNVAVIVAVIAVAIAVVVVALSRCLRDGIAWSSVYFLQADIR